MLRLTQHPEGVTTEPGDRVVYDVERDEAHYGAAHVDGHALVWELTERPEGGWLLRCDRVDFPPGGVAYRHTHPGPGLRVLLKGRIRIETQGESHEYGPLEWWYETGPDPVFAAASETRGDGVRPRPRPAGRMGREADDRVRRSGGRGEAEAAAGADLPRAAAVSRSGGQILVDQLRIHGADLVFGVPGESYLPVLDALRDSELRYVICRHEAGAANMADAYGKLTGRPGIAIVTRGPGATHASVGVHTAFQDSTPLILLVGQVGRDMTGREAFQEIDYPAMFGGIAKWVAQIERAERVPEYLYRAFTTATSGRPGPVVLALPEDMLAEEVEADDAQPYTPLQAHPGRGRAGAPARAARRRQAAVRDRRRRRVDGAGRDGLPRLRRGERAPRRRRVPAPGLRRQRFARLRRPRRHRPRPEARGARARRRPAARRRSAPRRVDDRRLHARRGRPAAPDPRPRPRRRRGARPRVPAGSSGSSPAHRSSPRRRGRWSPSTRRPGAPRPSRRTPTTSRAWSTRPGPVTCRWAT